MEKGTSAAFKKIREAKPQSYAEANQASGAKSYAVHDQLDNQERMWKEFWEHKESGEACAPGRLVGGIKPVSSEAFRSVARSVKANTSSIGGWHPRQVGELS